MRQGYWHQEAQGQGLGQQQALEATSEQPRRSWCGTKERRWWLHHQQHVSSVLLHLDAFNIVGKKKQQGAKNTSWVRQHALPCSVAGQEYSLLTQSDHKGADYTTTDFRKQQTAGGLEGVNVGCGVGVGWQGFESHIGTGGCIRRLCQA